MCKVELNLKTLKIKSLICIMKPKKPIKDHDCPIGKPNPRWYNVKITHCWTCYNQHFDRPNETICKEVFTPPSSPR